MEDALDGAKPSKERAGKAAACLERLLEAPAASIDLGLLLAGLANLDDLPDRVVYRLADAVRAAPPRDLGKRLAGLREGESASARFLALQLLGIADPAGLQAELAGPLPRTAAEANPRLYALALAVATLQDPLLAATCRDQIGRWNAEEKRVRDAWTGGEGFSVRAPEHPCLDAESLFRRIAHLAYLSRQAPDEFGPQFVREWLMIGVYQDYCDRTAWNKRPGDWSGLQAALGQLGRVTAGDLERLRTAQPRAFAEGCAGAHFTREFLAARNLLGDATPTAAKAILERLRTAANPDLAAFATARLAGTP
jgi:hypothetical protein